MPYIVWGSHRTENTHTHTQRSSALPHVYCLFSLKVTDISEEKARRLGRKTSEEVDKENYIKIIIPLLSMWDRSVECKKGMRNLHIRHHMQHLRTEQGNNSEMGCKGIHF
jgi:hypothetical protein